ncbi:MAG TPA: hypothetical protein VHV78_02405, partial [Gemmatimonadaceae bacterium]|nr:hypothetical protein [Gemmatimonadaceae bacterium]
MTVRRATANAIAAAYAGAWGETIGYSAVIVARDAIGAARNARAFGRTLNVRDGRAVATSLLAEFGPAGVLDT